ncbi:MAG: aminotransferase class V-fold PLP-dependent enzyme [Bacteroidales bacterium]
MNNLNRRGFINRSMAAMAGAVLAPAWVNAAASLQEDVPPGLQGAVDENWWRMVRSQFSLEDGLVYFNNGSLGPSPESVIDTTEKYRRILDAFPSRYMWGGWDEEKEDVRRRISGYFDTNPENIAITHNTTEGMNLFSRSFGLKPGDEIILADHEHVTGTTPYQYYCESRGVKLVRPVLPLMPSDPGEITEVYRKAVTPRTRLISMVHMTNTNGMILPVKEISDMAHGKGIFVVVDGAQTAGMFRINLDRLGCDCYAASGHKWLFGPKGTGILYARPEVIELLEPIILAHQFSKKNIRTFEDYNTRNLPEVLGLGSAIDFNNLMGQEVKEKRIYHLKHYFRSQLEGDNHSGRKTPCLMTVCLPGSRL